MSRCFPYPPPGFLKNNDGVVHEVLKERLKAIDQKEKKDRKKQEKYEADERNGKSKEKKHREHKKHKHEKKVKELHKNADFSGRIKEDNEQPERSCLSEEHGQPVCAQNFSDSFDSGRHGCKRKRPHDDLNRPCEPPTHKMHLTTCDSGGDHGKGIRLKFSIVRNNEQPQSCGYQGSSTMPADAARVPETLASPPGSVLGSNAVEPPTSKRVSRPRGSKHGTGECLPPLPSLPTQPSSLENLDWLFGENYSSCEAKELKSHWGAGDDGIPHVWSQASYIREGEVYALPYVSHFEHWPGDSTISFLLSEYTV